MRAISASDVTLELAGDKVVVALPGPSGRRRYGLDAAEAYRLANNIAEAAARVDRLEWPDAIEIEDMKFSNRRTADGSVVLALGTSKGPILLRLSGNQLLGLASLPAADAMDRAPEGNA